MEQAKHNWMWPPARKPNFNNPLIFPAMNNSSYGDSWEEQAFAEDAAGALRGGCVWPPRSYSCSFCRREFRSAQALGGHMNVHRRDRARLKQSSSSTILSSDQGVSDQHINHVPVNPYSPDQKIRTFLYNSPNPEYPDNGPLISPVSSVIRVSSSPPEDLSNLCLFSATKKHDKGNATIWSCNQPFSPEKRDWALDLILKEEKKPEKEDCSITEELSMGLNLVQAVCRKRSNPTNDHDEGLGSCKRRRIMEKPSNLFPRSMDRCHLPQSEMLKLCSGSSEEVLDLELRLGDAPKVK